MLKIYGRSDCPDCANCKASLDAKGIEYDFLNVNYRNAHLLRVS